MLKSENQYPYLHYLFFRPFWCPFTLPRYSPAALLPFQSYATDSELTAANRESHTLSLSQVST